MEQHTHTYRLIYSFVCWESACCFAGNIISALLNGDHNFRMRFLVSLQYSVAPFTFFIFVKRRPFVWLLATSLLATFVYTAQLNDRAILCVVRRRIALVAISFSSALQNVSNNRILLRSARPQTSSCIELSVVCGFMGNSIPRKHFCGWNLHFFLFNDEEISFYL